ncbi:MAG: hypothetical protein ACFCGT_04670 [Sandaracinaceae bacterium]
MSAALPSPATRTALPPRRLLSAPPSLRSLFLPVLAGLLAACSDIAPPPSLPPVIDPARDAAVRRCLFAPGSVSANRACGCNEDCAGADPICVPELASGLPGGQCLGACDPAADPEVECGPGGVCEVGASPVGVCFVGCTTRDDCAPDEVCTLGVCDRFCVADDQCDSGFCDRYSGRCALEELNPDGGGLLAPCLRADDCRSLLCGIFDPGQLCQTSCDLRRLDTCPGGGVCIALAPGDELGLCVPACDAQDECDDPGLECITWNDPMPDQAVCLPP